MNEVKMFNEMNGKNVRKRYLHSATLFEVQPPDKCARRFDFIAKTFCL